MKRRDVDYDSVVKYDIGGDVDAPLTDRQVRDFDERQYGASWQRDLRRTYGGCARISEIQRQATGVGGRNLGLCPGGNTPIVVAHETDDHVIGHCTCSNRWWFKFAKKKKPLKEKTKAEVIDSFVESAGKPVCSCHKQPLELDYADHGELTGLGLCAIDGTKFQWSKKPPKEVNKNGIIEEYFETRNAR